MAQRNPLIRRGEAHKALQQRIIKVAKMYGWLVYFTWRSDHSPAGFPDLVMVRGDMQVVAELKTGKAETTKDQKTWLKAFGEVTEHTYVVRHPRPKNGHEVDEAFMVRLLSDGRATLT